MLLRGHVRRGCLYISCSICPYPQVMKIANKIHLFIHSFTCSAFLPKNDFIQLNTMKPFQIISSYYCMFVCLLVVLIYIFSK